jgi:peptidylprolyl isomerase
MLKFSLAATALLAVGLSACLDDPSGPECSPITNNTVVETRGDTTVTSSGLRYIEIADGASSVEADWCSLAQVQYVGRLSDGTEFDSGDFSFTPGRFETITGFELGVVGMTVSSSRRLIIPPNLGYGSQDVVDRQTGEVVIPGNSTLIFDVQLIASQ